MKPPIRPVSEGLYARQREPRFCFATPVSTESK